ncbi:hypothetical protein DH2020_040357 [Rehmannia glutinosa]|uniref:Homeobox domain-containing protein n=1 Tax=Rehmannia glutinosa TaxID=99300 RepID=A0ABR0UTZ1_REHGL
MEWEKQAPPRQAEEPSGGGMFVKVMTDEQMEVLRKQIAVYATICEQLVELHKSLTSQNDLAGVRLGNLYCDPLITSGAHKITGRQRWTPTPMQLQILERIFDQGIGTPSKQKIKEITNELSQHGQISKQMSTTGFKIGVLGQRGSNRPHHKTTVNQKWRQR